jgi:3-hydroxyisobutyrate dehydrogenase-like beta-hydroxyacid dehydrogenase
MADQDDLIGLGIMSKPIAGNLVKTGYSLVVNTRSHGAVKELTAESDQFTAVKSPREVGKSGSDAIVFGEDGFLEAMGSEDLLIDST